MVKKQSRIIWTQIVSWYTKINDDIYKNIAEDVKTRFDTLSYELDRPIRKSLKSNWINER